MRKIFEIILLVFVVCSFAGCSSTIKGDNGLIEKAREEIPLSNAATTEIQIAGSVASDTSRLIWFVTGNEYQKHGYFPIEFELVGEEQFKFVRRYKPIERAYEIVVLNWRDGYCFFVNNSDCACISITEPGGSTKKIEVATLPFLYYYKPIPNEFEYQFLDAEGIEL